MQKNEDENTWQILFDNQKVFHDIIEVKCKRSPTSPFEFHSPYYQIVNKLPKPLSKKSSNSNCKPLEIILFNYESVSKIAWLKRLPKTSRFMFEIMKFEILHGFGVTNKKATG